MAAAGAGGGEPVDPIFQSKENLKEHDRLYGYLDPYILPTNSYIFFASEGHSPINPTPENPKPLPPMRYIWTQAKLPTPGGGKPKMPKLSNSWFIGPNTDSSSMYVYRVKRPLTLINFTSDTKYGRFSQNIINLNASLQNRLRNDAVPPDYVNVQLLKDLFNADGIYMHLGEIIIFSPYDDKLEFVKAYIGKNTSTEWEGTNLQAYKESMYFKTDPELLKRVTNIITSPAYEHSGRAKRFLKKKTLKGGKRRRMRLTRRRS
jgi:hypothetical protein